MFDNYKKYLWLRSASSKSYIWYLKYLWLNSDIWESDVGYLKYLWLRSSSLKSHIWYLKKKNWPRSDTWLSDVWYLKYLTNIFQLRIWCLISEITVTEVWHLKIFYLISKISVTEIWHLNNDIWNIWMRNDIWLDIPGLDIHIWYIHGSKFRYFFTLEI